MKDIDLSVIIPAYNEEEKILKDVEKAISYLKDRNYHYEIIVVDDGSQDQTKNLVFAYQAKSKELKIITYPRNRGKGFAVKTGVFRAQGKYILFADAGSCVPYDNLEKGIDLIKNGYDVAIGSRALVNSQILCFQPKYRIIGSKLFSFIVKFLMGIHDIRDTQCGFKLFKKEAAKKIFRMNKADRFMFDVEIILNAKKIGYSIKEFPVEWANDADTRFNPIKGTVNNLRELIKIKYGF